MISYAVLGCGAKGIFRALQLLYELAFLAIVCVTLSRALGVLIVGCVGPVHVDQATCVRLVCD